MFEGLLPLAVRHARRLCVDRRALDERPRFARRGAPADSLLYEAVGYRHYFAVFFGVPLHGGCSFRYLNMIK
jgi:hypothetical protein